MGTKIKGLLKGLRYITQKFDEDKEPEMKIGFPTDVKHVAHIVWDGPSVDSPSWMKEFKSPQGFQSAPLSVNGEPKENPEVKWVSQDSIRRSLRPHNAVAKDKDMLDLPKSSRLHSLPDSSTTVESLTENSSVKSRQSKRNSSNSTKSSRKPKDSNNGSDSSSVSLPDIPKKTRRKKTKDSGSGGSTRSSKSKVNAPIENPPLYSNPGPDTESISGSIDGELTEGDKG